MPSLALMDALLALARTTLHRKTDSCKTLGGGAVLRDHAVKSDASASHGTAFLTAQLAL